jgi:hypothetical protein
MNFLLFKCKLHVYPPQPSTYILSIANKSKIMLHTVKMRFLILNCCLVPLAFVLRVRLVMTARQDSQVLRALLDLGDCLACQDYQVSRDIVVFRAWMEQRASKGHQERRVHREVQGPLVLSVPW